MSSKLEPTIWSCDTSQQIPCFDSCQLTITWMSNTKDESWQGIDKAWPPQWLPCCATSSLSSSSSQGPWPAIHATGHVDHKKSNAWFSYFCACIILPILWLWGSARLRSDVWLSGWLVPSPGKVYISLALGWTQGAERFEKAGILQLCGNLRFSRW